MSSAHSPTMAQRNKPKNALPVDGPNASHSAEGEVRRRNVSSLGAGDSPGLDIDKAGVDISEECEVLLLLCILDNISIFSSFSSNRSFNSLTSPSSTLTLSSSDSVYPLGKALRLSLSLVLHSNPTFAHCEQHGRIPSHLIFLLLHLSQACAILLCALVPTLITFIGRIPGIFVFVRLSL